MFSPAGPAMAKSAQAWADKKVYKHSDSYKLPSPAGPAGENIAIGQHSREAATKAWYSEVKDCIKFPGCAGKNGKGKNGKPVGHFTAMIWKGVKEIGCGQSYIKGRAFYVC